VQRLPDRPSRRRREPISREAIVDAAVALLDRDGYDALSMRALGEELGTGAASLYWHVGSKDGLLDLVMDKLIGEVPVPTRTRRDGVSSSGRWRGHSALSACATPTSSALDRPDPDGPERRPALRADAGDHARRRGCRRCWPCRATC